MRSIRQPAAAVRLGLGLPSERRHRELYADARQAEIARVQQNFGSAAPPAGGTAELVLGDRPRGDGYEARQAARRKGFEAQASNTFPRMPDTAISTDEIFATAGLDPAAADGPARPPPSGCVRLRRAAARLGVAIGGAAQAAAGESIARRADGGARRSEQARGTDTSDRGGMGGRAARGACGASDQSGRRFGALDGGAAAATRGAKRGNSKSEGRPPQGGGLAARPPCIGQIEARIHPGRRACASRGRRRRIAGAGDASAPFG